MVPHTRRSLLRVATAGLVGLAGCNRLSGEATQSETVTASDESGGGADEPETNPPTALLRADSTTPPVRLSDPDEQAASTPSDRLYHRDTNLVIGSNERAERLQVDHPDSREAQSFLDETDFDGQTVYVQTRQVQECYRLKLCSVAWHPDEIETDYTRILRPYDERCAADDTVFESRLIRLPAALDENSVNSFSTSIGGSGRCDAGPAVRTEAPSEGTESGSTKTSARISGGELQ